MSSSSSSASSSFSAVFASPSSPSTTTAAAVLPATPHTIVFHYDVVCPYAYIASHKLPRLVARENERRRSSSSSLPLLRLVYRPVLLGGIYAGTRAPQGKAGSATDAFSRAKSVGLARDMRQQMARNGVELRWPSRHPQRTLAAQRLLTGLGMTTARGGGDNNNSDNNNNINSDNNNNSDNSDNNSDDDNDDDDDDDNDNDNDNDARRRVDEQRATLTAALYRAYWVDDRDLADEATLCDVAVRALPTVLDAARVRVILNDDAVKRALKHATDAAVASGAPGVPWVCTHRAAYWGQDRTHFVERDVAVAPALARAQLARFDRRCWPTPRAALAARAREQRRRLTFYFDYSSPWAYVAHTQIERVARECAAELEVVPLLLGALFRAVGTANMPLATFSAAKQAYAARDLRDWCAWWGVDDVRWPDAFPLRSVLPLRVTVAAMRAGAGWSARASAVSHALFRAAWLHNRDIGREDVVRSVLAAEQCSLAAADVDALLIAASSEPVRVALRENTARAVRAQLFGVPAFQVDGGACIWGQDRLCVVEDLLCGDDTSRL